MKPRSIIVCTSGRIAGQYSWPIALQRIGLLPMVPGEGEEIEYLPSIRPSDVAGKELIWCGGSVPLYLAAAAASVTVVIVTLAPEHDPNNLTVTDLLDAIRRFEQYQVKRVNRVNT